MTRHGTLVAYLALFVALATGTATAAKLIGSKQVKNNSLRSVDVRNGSLKAVDFRAGALPAGPAGAPGLNGTNGTNGERGPRGVSAWEAIPSGTTVTGSFHHALQASGSAGYIVTVPLGAMAPEPLATTDVNFAVDGIGQTSDDDEACEGTLAAPTAPPGKVCMYINTTTLDATGLQGEAPPSDQPMNAFYVTWTDTNTSTPDVYAAFSWAYTAP